MKRKPMNHIQEIIRRLQLGESERRIAQDLNIARLTVRRYAKIAKQHGYVEEGSQLPSQAELQAVFDIRESSIEHRIPHIEYRIMAGHL